jgi:hypothetical protein
MSETDLAVEVTDPMRSRWSEESPEGWSHSLDSGRQLSSLEHLESNDVILLDWTSDGYTVYRTYFRVEGLIRAVVPR